MYYWVCFVLRQERGRDGCCCCIRLPENYTESQCGSKDRFKTFFDKIYAPVLLSLPGKVNHLLSVNTFNPMRHGSVVFVEHIYPFFYLKYCVKHKEECLIHISKHLKNRLFFEVFENLIQTNPVDTTEENRRGNGKFWWRVI